MTQPLCVGGDVIILCVISLVKRLRRYLLLNTPWRRNLPHQRLNIQHPLYHFPLTCISVCTLTLLQLKGYGVSVVSGVDPNVDNFISAGIVNTRTTLIGCLMRLEPNKETKVTLWGGVVKCGYYCLLYTSPSPRDATLSRMPSSA